MAQANGSSNVAKRFSDRDLVLVKRSDDEQQALRDLVERDPNFSKEEKAALEIDSVAAFDVFWKSALQSKDKFEEAHEHGAKLAMRNLQDFGASASDIVQHMEPIVQVVKDFGAPSGGMAIGTITFFFTIAKNKASLEKSISSTLFQIRDRVAGLKVYRHIYNDDHPLDRQLQSKIVEAYDSFIGFCVVATKYYSRKGMGRWLRAFSGPSKTIGEHASRVQEAIVDVRYASEELLNKNVDVIKQLNISLKAQVKQLQEGHDSDRLADLKAMLGLETYSQEHEMEVFAKYQRDINAYLNQSWIYFERMQGLRLETFKAHPDVQAWQSSPDSRMLLLAGYNHESMYSSGECWLSPFAVDTIASMGNSGQADPYAFYILGRGELDLFPQVLSSIIVQLLVQNRQALRIEAQHAELRAEIKEYHEAANVGDKEHEEHKYSDKALRLLQKIALRVLNMFEPTQTVWIIIDRVDRCKLGSKFNHRKKLVKTMVHLVERAKVKVRVLAVVNGFDWKVDEQSDELEQSNEESVILHIDRQGVIN